MTTKTIIDALSELGLTPLDWCSAEKFATLTGISEQKLKHRKQEWPENVVWMKESGNLYYSIRGYNQWMTEQAKIRIRRASGLDRANSKSTLAETENRTTSRYPTQSLRKVSMQPLRLDVS